MSSDSEGAVSIEYGGIQHVGVLVEDTVASKKFYMEVLGMADDHALRSPKLPFEGTFLRAGNSQIHLMELPNSNPKDGRPEHGGRDCHAAVTVKCLEPLIASLEKHKVMYTFSKSGRRAVFVRDLDMNALEFVEVETL
jgi:glyoxylase I family protein